MPRLRLYQKAASIQSVELKLEAFEPQAGHDEVIVKVHSAGVNMSDVKASLGAMSKARWPRTPGRDFSGVIVDGPQDLLGQEVWGTGGDLGITRDGSHADYLVLPATAVRPKPPVLSLLEAGALGVPFVTAYDGLSRCGLPREQEVVLVFGANGKVGQAAIQIASMFGARIFGVEREREAYLGHSNTSVRMIDASSENIADVVRAETAGHGADIVFNTVGSVYFEAACAAMAMLGRQVFIATIERTVPFDIFAFYRSRHAFFGVDTLSLDATACAHILKRLAPGFNTAALRAFPNDRTYPLDRAKDAYQDVLAGSRDRVVLVP
jgi:NADPH2:quinone reductase